MSRHFIALITVILLKLTDKVWNTWSMINDKWLCDPRESQESLHWTAGDGAYGTWKKIKAEHENGSRRRREGEAIKYSDSNKGTMGDMLFFSDESLFHLSVSQLFFLLRENMNICVCRESVNNGRPHKDLWMCTHTEAHRQTTTHAHTHLPCGLGDVMFVVGWAAPDWRLTSKTAKGALGF